LKLRVGKKGVIVLPKAVREVVGLEEGDEVLVEIKDGILLKPARKVDVDEAREFLRQHCKVLAGIKGLKEPMPGELSQVCLEEEFEDEGIC
jgi:AbrB family looped-hinge helix DNA binding protein